MMSSGKKHLLVVDDEEAVVEYLCESLSNHGYEVTGTSSAIEALVKVRASEFDLVISDVEMPELRGVDLLRGILDIKPTQFVLLMTAYGSVETAVAAVQAGACDFLAKPFKIEALLHAIERAFSQRMLKREVVRLRAALSPSYSQQALVAKSNAMRRVLDQARRAAGSSSSVLITGETGSGKSLLARFIHDEGQRSKRPFVKLNCAAVPSSLAESELFGVRRGAYTDAHEDRDGIFVAAGAGTLFLDEIGELSLELQAKLLHVLETATVRPLGGIREVKTEARIIAATNRPAEELLREGSFRPDLYYRINVVRIELPPLRERKDDIVPLVDTLLAQLRGQDGRPIVGISAQAIRRLMRHSWPGNIRELNNVIERAVAMAEHDVILPEDLDFDDALTTSESNLDVTSLDGLTLEEVERVYVEHVVKTQNGNKAAAARILGITRRTLYRKLGEVG